MRRLTTRLTAHAAFVVLPFVASTSRAQESGFVVTLGSDTVQVERYARAGNRIEGTLVTRSPVTRKFQYTIELTAGGLLSRYTIQGFDGSGAPLRTNWSAGSLTVTGDSVVRETLRDNQVISQRLAAPSGVMPGPMLPYLGIPFVSYEIGHAQARRAATGTESSWYSLTLLAGQMQPQQTRVWLVGTDSLESDYFGVARIGFKFDDRGRLLRSDWTATTYRYLVRQVAAVDVEAIARNWVEADRGGKAMGPMSPRDTLRATVGSASITIEYSRPSRRGRLIWGGLVPWQQVWRFGADVATHLTTTGDLVIGGERLPAGTYTLWMLPSERGPSQLIVNRQTRVFGTQYNPGNDLVRIPLTREAGSSTVERFTLAVDGGRFWIRWGDASWSVALRSDPP